MPRIFTGVCLVCIVLVPRISRAELAAKSAHPIAVHDPEGVIVPAALARKFMNQLNLAYYTPTSAEIRTLESKLPAYLESLAKGSGFPAEMCTPSFIASQRRYFRQYVGYIERTHHLIRVSTACIDRAQWRRDPIVAADGGNCFWRITFDEETGRFSDLDSNGE
jgi:hypothetical protein